METAALSSQELQEKFYERGRKAAVIAESYIDPEYPDDCLSKLAKEIADHLTQNLGGD